MRLLMVSRRARVTSFAALVAIVIVAGGCAALYPPQAVTEQGEVIRSLYGVVFIIAAAIFLIVEGAIVFIVLRYRHDSRDELLPKQTHGHTGVEILWTLIPFVIVAFLFFISWQALGRVVADPSQQAGVRVKVIAYQWCWEFDYVDEGVKVQIPAVNSKGQNCVDENGARPTLVLPVGERIRLQLHSNDVIHAFYVPQFVSKLDVVPQANEARDNVFDFTPISIGEYRGQCAEFCGLNHFQMVFAVRVVSQADYKTWITEQKNKPSPTPAVTPGAGVTPPPGAVTLQVAAIPVLKFDQSTLSAPANTPFIIAFDNRDTGQSHNVSIQDASATLLFSGQPIVTGPGQATYVVDTPLPPGTYRFFCIVHPTVMFGTLEVR